MKSAKTAILSLILTTTATFAFADGDIDKGAKVFRKCKSCHEVGEGAQVKTGPVLTGIIGSTAARDPEFAYSDALKDAAAGGLVWTEETLTEFLKKPRNFVKGTKMSFAGLRKPQDIENILAYLGSVE